MERNRETDAMIKAKIEEIVRKTPLVTRMRYERKKVIDQHAGTKTWTEVWYGTQDYGGGPTQRNEETIEMEVGEKSHYEDVPVSYETYGSLFRAAIILNRLPGDIRAEVFKGFPSQLQRELEEYKERWGCCGTFIIGLAFFTTLCLLQYYFGR